MPDNNFEKRLQEQMEGFKLQPSEQVWDEVEQHIRKKKDRRRIIFWWLLPALLAGGIFTAVKFSNTGDKKILFDNNTITTVEKGNTPTEIKSNAEAGSALRENKTITDPLAKEEKSANNTSPDLAHADNSSIAAANDKKDYSQKVFIKEQKGVRRNAPVNKNQINSNYDDNRYPEFNMDLVTKPVIKIQNESRVDEKPVVEKQAGEEIAAGSNEKKPELDNKPVAVETVKTDEPKMNLNDTASPATDVQVVDIAKKTAADSISMPVEQKATVNLKKKWQFGFSFEIGASDLSKSLIPGAGAEDKSAAAVFQSPIVGGFVSIPKAAEERTGAAFSVKAFMHKNIKRRLDLQAGINYSYFSTIINVGNRVDATRVLNYVVQDVRVVSGFYNSTAASSVKNDYTNRYHLAGLYGQLNWRITNWKKKAAIYWNNGLSINQLFASNALVYDQTGAVYYKDFDVYQKQMAGISSALSFRFYNTNKLSITAGPFMQYYLTPYLKEAGPANKHFRNYGINMQVLFKK